MNMRMFWNSEKSIVRAAITAAVNICMIKLKTCSSGSAVRAPPRDYYVVIVGGDLGGQLVVHDEGVWRIGSRAGSGGLQRRNWIVLRENRRSACD